MGKLPTWMTLGARQSLAGSRTHNIFEEKVSRTVRVKFEARDVSDNQDASSKSDQDNKRNKQQDKKQAVANIGLELCLKIDKGRFLPPFIPSFLPSTTLIRLTFLAKFLLHPLFSNPTLKMSIMVLIHSSPLRSLLEAQKFKHVYYTPSVVRNLKTTFCAKNTTCKLILKRKDGYFKNILHNRI